MDQSDPITRRDFNRLRNISSGIIALYLDFVTRQFPKIIIFPWRRESYFWGAGERTQNSPIP